MWKVIKNIFRAVAALLLISSCSENGEPDGDDGEREKVRIAVILPFDEEGTDWSRVLGMVKENVRRSSRAVEPEYEIYDENTVDIKTVAAELARRDDVAAVIGCYHSANTLELAYKCAATYKPVFTFSSSEELQRAFGRRGFLWSLSESDITQSELLLIKAERYGARSVSLLACDDIYGKTFIDWFAFQARELGLEPVAAETYGPDDSLAAKFAAAAVEEVDYLICVPSDIDDACEMVETYRASGFRGRLLFSDVADSTELISRLGPGANGVEGVAMVADPSTGFDVSYEVEFGVRPEAGEAQIYDAVMIACYAFRYGAVHGLDMNEAASALLYNPCREKGMWTSGSMERVFNAVEAGETPAFSGASGTLDFDSSKYTSIQYSTYAHWLAYNGRFVHLDYDVRSDYSTSSAYAAWEWNKQYMQQFDPGVDGIAYPPKEGNIAVIVAASERWPNYRHQADALAFYQMLKANGYDDDRIVLVMADDIADNPNNPSPGVVRHAAGGENLYENVEIDYRLADLTPDGLREVLLGLNSGPGDNLLLFWSGHGEPGKWLWGESDAFGVGLLSETVEQMAAAGKFRKMLGLIETCYSGSMGRGIEGVPGVLFMTAANENETSKADDFSTDLGVWLTNRFTTTLLNSVADNPAMSLRELYYRLFSSTLGSHVTVYNADCFGNIYDNSMAEFLN